MEKVIDSFIQGENHTVSQEENCTKRKYQRAGYQMILFLKPDQTIGGSLKQARIFEVAPNLCLKEAENLLEKYSNQSGIKIMRAYRERFPDFYTDPDISPVKWLSCTIVKNTQYYDAWSTWIHEVVHDLRDKNCLFNPYTESDKICFDIPSNLPDREVSKIAKFPTNKSFEKVMLNSIQNTYFSGLNEPALMLFDEVNGYTQTLLSWTLLMKNEGYNSLYINGTRNAVLLPLFMVYSLNYQDYLKHNNKIIFDKYFSKGSVNNNNLRIILSNAERAYQNWLKINSCAKCTKYDFEKNLWKEYRKRKKNALF